MTSCEEPWVDMRFRKKRWKEYGCRTLNPKRFPRIFFCINKRSKSLTSWLVPPNLRLSWDVFLSRPMANLCELIERSLKSIGQKKTRGYSWAKFPKFPMSKFRPIFVHFLGAYWLLVAVFLLECTYSQHLELWAVLRGLPPITGELRRVLCHV